MQCGVKPTASTLKDLALYTVGTGSARFWPCYNTIIIWCLSLIKTKGKRIFVLFVLLVIFHSRPTSCSFCFLFFILLWCLKSRFFSWFVLVKFISSKAKDNWWSVLFFVPWVHTWVRKICVWMIHVDYFFTLDKRSGGLLFFFYLGRQGRHAKDCTHYRSVETVLFFFCSRRANAFTEERVSPFSLHLNFHMRTFGLKCLNAYWFSKLCD